MNQKTNFIKWLAVITMTIDHIGFFLFPGVMWLRIIGRIAFPCFLYTTIQGVSVTRNFPNYWLRLVGTGVVSILVTSLFGNIWNILFSLAIFSLSLYDRRFILPGLLLANFTEYGLYGFLLGWAIKITVDGNRWLGMALILLLHLPEFGSVQFFAVFALLPFCLPFPYKLPRLPKWLGYAYYPIHQLILIGIGWYL